MLWKPLLRLNLIMFASPLNLLILLMTFITSLAEPPEKSRDFFSKRLKNKQINAKLHAIELFHSRGISQLLPRIVEECKIVLWNGKEVETGYMFEPSDLRYPPKVSWTYKKGHYYTLFLGDIDNEMEDKFAPNSPFRGYCKWMVSNIPGCDIEKGKQIFAYSPPQKRPPNELRRYLVLIYDQQYEEPINFSEGGYFEVDQMGDFLHMDGSKERRDFRVNKFTDWYNFGFPIAANLYMILN